MNIPSYDIIFDSSGKLNCNFFEATDALYILLDDQLVVMAFNKAAENYFGWPKDLVLKKNFANLCALHQIEFPLTNIALDVELNQTKVLGTTRINNFLGEEYVLKWWGMRLFSQFDRKNMLLLSAVDITSEVNQEREQSSLHVLSNIMGSVIRPDTQHQNWSEANNYHTLQSIVPYLPGCVYMKDFNGAYIACNEYLIKNIGGLSHSGELLGYTDWQLRDAVGERWTDQFVRAIQEDDQTVTLSKKPLINKLETPFLDADGQVVCQVSRKIPIRDETGAIIGLFGISLDKSAEIELPILRKMYKDLYNNARQGHNSFVRHFFGPELAYSHPISEREFDCLYYLSTGKSQKEISRILAISPRTVETHILSMRSKMNLHSVSQIINVFHTKSSLTKK